MLVNILTSVSFILYLSHFCWKIISNSGIKYKISVLFFLDLSLRDKSGLTPFATALTVKNHKAAQSIVDRLPNAAEQTDGRGRNFLHTAILKGDMESVLFLLASGVDVNSRVQDSDQTPPIHLAALSGDETLLRSLVLAGARVNDRDAHKYA